jgi:MFS family permease
MTLPPDRENARARTGSAGKWMALIAAFLGWMFDGFEMGLYPLVARPALLELGLPQDQIGGWLGIVTAVFLVGAALGGVLFGWLGDRIGRVRAMVWSVLTYAVFSGLCGFATTPWQLAVPRFIASLGMGGEWALGVALVMELWPSASRPILAGLIGAAANVGFLAIALVGLGIAHIRLGLEEVLVSTGLSQASVTYLMGADGSAWRILLFVGAVPALLTFFIRIFVPESERWKAAARNAPKPRVEEIFAPRLRRNTLLGTALGALALIGTWGSVQWLPHWAHQMTQGTGTVGAREWTQIASAIGAIFGTIIAALLAERYSRRASYFLFTLASLAACGFLFWTPARYGGGFLLAVGAVGLTTASFYGWLPLYLPELFPTRLRATGQGFAFNAGRVLAAGGALASGQILDAFHEDYALMCRVISMVYVLGLVVIWFCPETKGRPLPE